MNRDEMFRSPDLLTWLHERRTGAASGDTSAMADLALYHDAWTPGKAEEIRHGSLDGLLRRPDAPALCMLYARDVLSARWPEAEPTIARDPVYAYLYAREVIGARWPEAEPIIARDPGTAYNYAVSVLHMGRADAHRWAVGRAE